MTEHESPALTVVGVGASAGGLKALRLLFAAFPENPGLAFVVIVHLAPSHESALAELLQPCTRMRVRQVTEDTKLEADSVYVIPPGRNLSTIDSHLRLSPQDEEAGRRAPIDIFFRRLADTHRERAIGVILTGTGSDGTLGLARIKENGGLCIVQDPDESEFDGMPRSAIASGLVDLVLPVEKIAGRILEMTRLAPDVPVPDEADASLGDQAQTLRNIFGQVRARSGHDFSRYKLPTVMRRIRRRMLLNQIGELESYLEFIRANPDETRALSKDLLITVTGFFRDRNVFEYLERDVLPSLFEGRGPEDMIRVWVVGCATGEEAYSLAILLHEIGAARVNPPGIQVFASDLHADSLKRARNGLYPESMAGEVGPDRLNRFFTREDQGYRVSPTLRESVVFAQHSFLRDPPFSRVDLVSCRNVLIYLQRDIQREVLNLFHYALNPDGILLLGLSETIESSSRYRILSRECGVFQKCNVRSTEPKMPLLPEAFSKIDRLSLAGGSRRIQPLTHGELHQQVLEALGPPSVLVNEDHEIIHYHRAAGRYLDDPGGEPTNNVFKRIRENLRSELRSVMYASKKYGRPVRSHPVNVRIEGEERRVVIRSQAVREGDAAGHFLVLFDEVADETPPGDTVSDDATGSSSRELELELELTQNRLQSSIEDFEDSQEAMRVANEQLQSTNEELRSTMEELETSKEELQSMNEELMTVNQENRHRVEELSVLTSDLQNLLAATDIASLFLDQDLRILRFTPRMSEIFNIREADSGRPVTDFTHSLGYTTLVADAREVFRTLQPVERNVRGGSGGWYLLRLLPYRTVEDRISGVVMTVVDVSSLKEAELQLRRSESELKTLAASLEKRVAERSDQVRHLASRLTLAEQTERDRIAKILHDELQQRLCSIQMKLFVLSLQASFSKQDADELSASLASAIDMTRRLAVDLSPPVLTHEGLTEALRWLGRQMKNLHDLEVDVDTTDSLLIRNNGMRVTLFQVIRELLFNVVKHSGSNEASVSLVRAGDIVHVSVRDGGRGFDPSGLERATGFGLRDIRERISLFGGDLSIHSRPGEGTVVDLSLPVPESDPPADGSLRA